MPAQMLPFVYKLLGSSAILTTGVGVLAVIDFSSTITLGSILIGVVVVVVAGLFTIRSNIANIWRQDAEGQRLAKERLQEELIEARASRAKFDREQQELRHDIKDELAACKAQLKAMEAKTDLTVALDAIKQMNEGTIHAISHAFADIVQKTSLLSEQRDSETQRLLTEIRDKLPGQPIEVVDVTPDHHTD